MWRECQWEGRVQRADVCQERLLIGLQEEMTGDAANPHAWIQHDAQQLHVLGWKQMIRLIMWPTATTASAMSRQARAFR